MGGLGAFFMGLAGPMAKRVLTALGFGVVSYVGVDTALNAAIAAARSSWSGMAAFPAAMLAMSGMGTACGILVGALAARLSMTVLKKLIPK